MDSAAEDGSERSGPIATGGAPRPAIPDRPAARAAMVGGKRPSVPVGTWGPLAWLPRVAGVPRPRPEGWPAKGRAQDSADQAASATGRNGGSAGDRRPPAVAAGRWPLAGQRIHPPRDTGGRTTGRPGPQSPDFLPRSPGWPRFGTPQLCPGRHQPPAHSNKPRPRPATMGTPTTNGTGKRTLDNSHNIQRQRSLRGRIGLPLAMSY